MGGLRQLIVNADDFGLTSGVLAGDYPRAY